MVGFDIRTVKFYFIINHVFIIKDKTICCYEKNQMLMLYSLDEISFACYADPKISKYHELHHHFSLYLQFTHYIHRAFINCHTLFFSFRYFHISYFICIHLHINKISYSTVGVGVFVKLMAGSIEKLYNTTVLLRFHLRIECYLSGVMVVSFCLLFCPQYC